MCEYTVTFFPGGGGTLLLVMIVSDDSGTKAAVRICSAK